MLSMTGDVGDHPAVVYGRGRRITVERIDGEALIFEHDGDVVAQQPSFLPISVLAQRFASPYRVRCQTASARVMRRRRRGRSESCDSGQTAILALIRLGIAVRACPKRACSRLAGGVSWPTATRSRSPGWIPSSSLSVFRALL